MYNSKRASETVQIKNPISVGISENLKIKNIESQESVNGNTYLSIEVVKENPDGTISSVKHTEWEQTKFPNMSDEDYFRSLDNQFKKIEQVLKAIGYTSEQLVFDGDWKALTQWAKDLWDKSENKDSLYRIKFVYDNKNYVTFPRYADNIFIEPMFISKEDSQIQIRKNDRLTPIIGDSSAQTTNKDAAEENKDDLPF